MGLWKRLRRAALAGGAAGRFACGVITGRSESGWKQVEKQQMEWQRDKTVQNCLAKASEGRGGGGLAGQR